MVHYPASMTSRRDILGLTQPVYIVNNCGYYIVIPAQDTDEDSDQNKEEEVITRKPTTISF
jgi:hypothetical protein